MKSIWLFIIMIGGVAQLRAQQLTPSAPTVKSPGNFIYPNFKAKPNNSLFKLSPVSPDTGQSSAAIPIVKELMAAPEMVYHMPIVKTRSDDKMPIAKLGDPNTHYTMLIQGYNKAKADSSSRTAIRP
jgi:hypothetical protein